MSLSADPLALARFDRLMHRVERKVLLDDSIEYERVGVRWYGNGAFVRDRALGADIARKQQWVVRAGDVVYNKLFAWKGAFAVADETVDGLIVSDKFPTYAVDEAQVDPQYLGYFFRTHQLAFQAERLSKGAAAISKLTLNPPQFWDLTIPLPSLDEQKQIVSLLRRAEAGLEEARRLRQEAQAEAAALASAIIGERLESFAPKGELAEVLEDKPRNGWSAPCDNAGDGTPVLSLGAVTGFVYRPSEYKRTSEPTEPGAHYWLSAGDLLMTRSNTEQLVGHAAIYTGEPSPCIYPDLMMKLKVNNDRAETRFVYYWLRSPLIRTRIEDAGRGTSSTMKKITQKHVMSLPFPVGLPLADQRRVVQALDETLAKVEDLRNAQIGSREDIDALLPALLDRAFEGELDEELEHASL
jgi:type I restriction enzyme, S subunit